MKCQPLLGGQVGSSQWTGGGGRVGRCPGQQESGHRWVSMETAGAAKVRLSMKG